MQTMKPLLWLLEPYIVYKAYLWGAQFVTKPLTWEGDIDWFSLTLALLLIIDAVVLPLVLLYLPYFNADKPVPAALERMMAPLERLVLWIDGKQLSPLIMKAIGALWAFFIYLVPVYIGGQLVLAVVIALMYDVLLWATVQVQ